MDVFEVIAEPTRRSILELLTHHRQLSAGEIARHFPASLAAISQHLRALREAKLVTVKKDGQKRMYELNIEGLYAFEAWAHKMTSVVERRFDALERVLLAKKASLKNKK